MPCIFEKTGIDGLLLVLPRVFEDNRGNFAETYKKSEFDTNGIHDDFVQDNTSFSQEGVLRGFHYQNPPTAQAKLVRCIKGEMIDVALDIRKESPTYGKWHAAELTEENKKMLYIPVGFAHAYYALTDIVVHYKLSAEYSPTDEGYIVWNDPEISVEWPVACPLLSDKDCMNPLFRDAINSFA